MLGNVHVLVSTILADAHAAGFDDVTLVQARVFARVGPDGTRLTDLAAHPQVTKQTAGHFVDELGTKGYLVRVPDPSDGRARLVQFGTRGLAAAAAAIAAEAAVEAQWRDHLGPDAINYLGDALRALLQITDPCVEPA